MERQHDDHIWLTVGGSAWAILTIDGPFLMLWRGYEPDLEYCVIEMSEFNSDSYADKAVEMLYGRRV